VPIQPRQPTAKGPADWFTGDVWIDGIARGEEPSRVRVSAVRFTPSARTAWHSHALGHTLYVTEGQGRLQSRGGDIEEIHAGDVVRPRHRRRIQRTLTPIPGGGGQGRSRDLMARRSSMAW
jgi:hypothetical protein